MKIRLTWFARSDVSHMSDWPFDIPKGSFSPVFGRWTDELARIEPSSSASPSNVISEPNWGCATKRHSRMNLIWKENNLKKTAKVGTMTQGYHTIARAASLDWFSTEMEVFLIMVATEALEIFFRRSISASRKTERASDDCLKIHKLKKSFRL